MNVRLRNLFLKARADVPRSVAAGDDMRNSRISTIINDALASAGLIKGTHHGGNVASVIEEALTRAGIHGPAHVGANTESADLTHPGELQTQQGGSFLSRSFRSAAGSLVYKVYVPAGYASDLSRTYPLVVMLHGCTQSPDDFAAGTRMNALADQQGFLVAYPAQSANANGSKCWNWFRPQDQVRGQGEPALIAGMTAQIQTDYRIDPSRVYVAGLSAGAAMAVVLGQAYPEVFAAVGVHSGLPYRAAHDVGSAFAAMKGNAASGRTTLGKLVPTIVFHGDRDHTVAASNGDAVVLQMGQSGSALMQSDKVQGKAASGRGFTRTQYSDASGHVVVEDWRIHGGGHAWMGGSATGSYTDPQGPDASTEMLRFFLSQTSGDPRTAQ